METVNLYSAFVALSLTLLENRGQIVAIIPRSFCNGPYYRPFREFVLKRAAIRHLHLFASRNKAFKDDAVLQENVIIMCERGVPQGDVTVTTSTDDSFTDLQTYTYPFERIVFPDDQQRFIHIPTSPGHNALERSTTVHSSLSDKGTLLSGSRQSWTGRANITEKSTLRTPERQSGARLCIGSSMLGLPSTIQITLLGR